jgi:hypothetical protein
MTGPRLTYWPSGGDVVATHGRVITPDEALRLRHLYLREAEASATAGDHRACRGALRMAMELRHALDAGARWRRAGVAPYASTGGPPSRAANASRESTLGGGVSGTEAPRKSHSGLRPPETS